MSTPTKPSIVFCHGILGRWLMLQQGDARVPGRGLRGDLRAVRPRLQRRGRRRGGPLLLGQVSSPVILVGHSYGGAVITAAGTDDRVGGLVYIAALGPDETETSQGRAGQVPRDGPVHARSRSPTGASGCLTTARRTSAATCPRRSSRSSGRPPPRRPRTCSTSKAPGVAWKTKPSWYIVANNDQAVNPELERVAAKRMGATTYDIDSSHVPMLSHPDFVLDVIRAAARGI